MKTIGLIGGMSWESSAEYYRLINEIVRERLGRLHSAKCLMYSVDFAEIEPLQHSGDWKDAADLLADAARVLQEAGADCVLICTNTMHKIADEVQTAVSIPLIHIVDVTGRAVQSQGLTTVGLLGTKFTMEDDFYAGKLSGDFGLKVLIPDETDRAFVHSVIYDELCQGRINPSSKEGVLSITNRLAENGAQGIILGCTELPLLVRPGDMDVGLFDTTAIHAAAAVDFALT